MPHEPLMTEKDVLTWKKALQHPRWRNPTENGALYGFYHPRTNTTSHRETIQEALDAGCIPHWAEGLHPRCVNWDQHLVQLVTELEQELRAKGKDRKDLPSPFGLMGWGTIRVGENPAVKPDYTPISLGPDYLLCLWDFLARLP